MSKSQGAAGTATLGGVFRRAQRLCAIIEHARRYGGQPPLAGRRHAVGAPVYAARRHAVKFFDARPKFPARARPLERDGADAALRVRRAGGRHLRHDRLVHRGPRRLARAVRVLDGGGDGGDGGVHGGADRDRHARRPARAAVRGGAARAAARLALLLRLRHSELQGALRGAPPHVGAARIAPGRRGALHRRAGDGGARGRRRAGEGAVPRARLPLRLLRLHLVDAHARRRRVPGEGEQRHRRRPRAHAAVRRAADSTVERRGHRPGRRFAHLRPLRPAPRRFNMRGAIARRRGVGVLPDLRAVHDLLQRRRGDDPVDGSSRRRCVVVLLALPAGAAAAGADAGGVLLDVASAARADRVLGGGRVRHRRGRAHRPQSVLGDGRRGAPPPPPVNTPTFPRLTPHLRPPRSFLRRAPLRSSSASSARPSATTAPPPSPPAAPGSKASSYGTSRPSATR